MVAALCRFLAVRPVRSSSPVFMRSKLLSRWTDRGISKLGEPRRPTSSRILPSTGTMTLVASRQLAPVRPPAGYAIRLPRKFRGPMAVRETRKDVLENSALLTESPSATIVPVPTVLR